MTPSSKTASYITSFSHCFLDFSCCWAKNQSSRLIIYIHPSLKSHDMCHGQKSLIRGMVIEKNLGQESEKYRYNMHMCLCRYIHIHLHLHPTLENPQKWLYNAIYTCICPLPLPFWHPKMTFAKTSAPSFGKRSHHDTMVSKGALEAIPSSTAQKWNVLLQRSKRCTAQKYGTWKHRGRRSTLTDFFTSAGGFSYRWEKRLFF